MSGVDRDSLPVPGPEPAFAFPGAVKLRLDNGLGVWTVHRDQLPLVSVVLLLPAGAALDPVDQPGLAALTADMLDEGSGRRSAIEMQEALARLGADLDTEAGPDAVVLSLTLLERYLADGLQLLADIVCRPRLSHDDCSRVRDLRTNRLRQLRDVPGANAEAVFARALFGTHAYGHLPIGTTASLDRLQASDVARFHASTYAPARATLILVGAASHASCERTAADAFGAWRDSPVDGGIRTGMRPVSTPMATAGRQPHAQEAAPSPATARPAAGSRVLIVDRPGAAQTELRIGHVAVPRQTPDFHALMLLNAVLGGHFMSRINLNLRERRGVTYGARSAFDFRRQAGPFSVQTSVQTAATGEAVREVLSELQDIRGDRPASDEELTLSKATLTKGYPRNFETTGQVARGLAQLALYELADDTFASFGPRVRALDREAVTRAAVTYLNPAGAVVVAVGDRARIEDDLRRLRLGDPALTTAEL